MPGIVLRSKIVVVSDKNWDLVSMELKSCIPSGFKRGSPDHLKLVFVSRLDVSNY